MGRETRGSSREPVFRFTGDDAPLLNLTCFLLVTRIAVLDEEIHDLDL